MRRALLHRSLHLARPDHGEHDACWEGCSWEGARCSSPGFAQSHTCFHECEHFVPARVDSAVTGLLSFFCRMGGLLLARPPGLAGLFSSLVMTVVTVLVLTTTTLAKEDSVLFKIEVRILNLALEFACVGWCYLWSGGRSRCPRMFGNMLPQRIHPPWLTKAIGSAPHTPPHPEKVLGGRRRGQMGLSTLRGAGGGRDQGRYARASPIPYPEPIPYPTGTNNKSVVVHTDRKTEDRYM